MSVAEEELKPNASQSGDYEQGQTDDKSYQTNNGYRTKESRLTNKDDIKTSVMKNFDSGDAQAEVLNVDENSEKLKDFLSDETKSDEEKSKETVDEIDNVNSELTDKSKSHHDSDEEKNISDADMLTAEEELTQTLNDEYNAEEALEEMYQNPEKEDDLGEEPIKPKDTNQTQKSSKSQKASTTVRECVAKNFNINECPGPMMRGSYKDPFKRFIYGNDYRDPEPPPLNENTFRKMFSSKVVETECWDESMKALMSRTELKNQMHAVLLGTYKTVSSVGEAIKKRKNLLDSIPKHTTREMRWLTLPPSVYLPLELEEDNFIFSRNTLIRFMDLDDKLIHVYEEREQTNLARRPLRENKYYLIVLSEALKLIEVYGKHGRRTEMYSLYMYLGQFFENLHSTWCWLAYELYLLAADTVTSYKTDLGFGEAIVKFILGKFCYNKLRDSEEALPLFQAAYTVSLGRMWTTEPLTRNKDENIHTESSFMMHICCLSIANEIIDTDPKRATDLGFLAYKRVVETGKHPEIEDALRGLARLYQQAKRPETALVVLTRQMKQSRELKDWAGLANAYFLTAFCLKSLKKYDKAFEYLKFMDTLSVRHNEFHLEALAAKSIGEYYLTKDEYVSANTYLTRAMEKYLAVGLKSEAYRCSIHIGAARAAIQMPLYIHSVMKTKTKNEMYNLLGWQLSEDPNRWRDMISILDKDEDQMSEVSASGGKRQGPWYYSVQQTLLMPNHPRVRNSLYNVSDIQMIRSVEDVE